MKFNEGIPTNERLSALFVDGVYLDDMREIFKKEAPEKFEEFQGNCCRQSAVFGAYFLNRLLPEYEWTVWDGIFEDDYFSPGIMRRYNHAWIFGKHKVTGKRILADFGAVHKEQLFLAVDHNAYPRDGEYKNLIEISRERLDWEKMIQTEVEWFTQKPSMEVINMILY